MVMALRRSLVVVSGQGAAVLPQKSHPKTFAPLAPCGGRGREGPGRGGQRRGGRGVARARPALAARVPLPEVERDAFLVFWSRLLMRRLGAVPAIARTFERTEQTARNWIDGTACPNGLDVYRATALWPDDFATRAPRMPACRTGRGA